MRPGISDQSVVPVALSCTIHRQTMRARVADLEREPITVRIIAGYLASTYSWMIESASS